MIQKAIKAKFHARMVSLLSEAETVAASGQTRQGRARISYMETGEVASRNPDYEVVDSDKLIEWTTKCATVLSQVIPCSNPNHKVIEEFRELRQPDGHIFRYLVARLRAIKDDFEQGLFDDAWLLIRAEVAGDYLAQAELLFAEGYYVPATVLAGAVLEDALRRLCDQHKVATLDVKGNRKTISPMNTDLYKGMLYNVAKMQEIQAWAALRNDAAHGNAQSEPQAVGRMIAGVRAFVGDYLR